MITFKFDPFSTKSIHLIQIAQKSKLLENKTLAVYVQQWPSKLGQDDQTLINSSKKSSLKLEVYSIQTSWQWCFTHQKYGVSLPGGNINSCHNGVGNLLSIRFVNLQIRSEFK